MGHDSNHTPAHYIRIWGVLCVLLVISILGPELEIQVVTLITAFGIAFVKAYLVIKHFMHFNTEKPIIWYMMITGFALMVVFVAGTAPDVHNHDGARWSNTASKAWIEQQMIAGEAGAEHHGGDHAADGDHAEGDDHAHDEGAKGADHGEAAGH